MYVRDEVMMLEDFSAAGPGRWSPNHSVMDGHFGSQTQIDIISQFLIDTDMIYQSFKLLEGSQ